MSSNNPRAKRVVVYSWWGLNTALSVAFAALSCTNAGNLRRAGWADTRDPAAVSRGNDQKRAVLAASVLGTAMVLVYSLISFLLLLRNMISSTLVSGFWYGVLMASSLHVALFMLLSALVLQIFKASIDAGTDLSQQFKDVYKVSLGLSYILIATYLIQLLLFWLWQTAFTDEPSSLAAASGSGSAPRKVIALQGLQAQNRPNKKATRDQKAIEFNRSLQGGYNTMVV